MIKRCSASPSKYTYKPLQVQSNINGYGFRLPPSTAPSLQKAAMAISTPSHVEALAIHSPPTSPETEIKNIKYYQQSNKYDTSYTDFDSRTYQKNFENSTSAMMYRVNPNARHRMDVPMASKNTNQKDPSYFFYDEYSPNSGPTLRPDTQTSASRMYRSDFGTNVKSPTSSKSPRSSERRPLGPRLPPSNAGFMLPKTTSNISAPANVLQQSPNVYEGHSKSSHHQNTNDKVMLRTPVSLLPASPLSQENFKFNNSLLPNLPDYSSTSKYQELTYAENDIQLFDMKKKQLTVSTQEELGSPYDYQLRPKPQKIQTTDLLLDQLPLEQDVLNSSGHSGNSAFSACSGLSSYTSASPIVPYASDDLVPSPINNSGASGSCFTNYYSTQAEPITPPPHAPIPGKSSYGYGNAGYTTGKSSNLGPPQHDINNGGNSTLNHPLSCLNNNNNNAVLDLSALDISQPPSLPIHNSKKEPSTMNKVSYTNSATNFTKAPSPYSTENFGSNVPAYIDSPLSRDSNLKPSQGVSLQNNIANSTDLSPNKKFEDHLSISKIHRSQTFSDITADDLLLPPPTRSYTTSSFMSKLSSSGTGDAGSFTDSFRSSSYSTKTDDDSLMLRLGLPSSIPDSRAQLDPTVLSSRDFNKCPQPWFVSKICQWIIQLNQQHEMTTETLSEVLIALFRHYIQTLGWVASERITVPLMEGLMNAGFLSIDKESGVLIVDPACATSGILPTITGYGCYSLKIHSNITQQTTTSATSTTSTSGSNDTKKMGKSLESCRCYSPRCLRTIPYKAVLPQLDKAQQLNDSDRMNWAKIWNVTDSDLAKLDKRVIERQCAIQELIGTEELYVRNLKAFLSVYGERLNKAKPPIVPNQKKFWEDTFGCIPGLIESNDNQFLTHLKVRQIQQGPFIECIADLILNWLKGAKQPYLSRATTYSYAMRVVTNEKAKKNELFLNWLEDVERDSKLNRQQKFDFLIASPFTRLCRYNLLFERIKATTPPDTQEHRLLSRCIDECKQIVTEYNRIHGEAEDLSSIIMLEERIIFPNPEQRVDLRLADSRRRRKILYQGDVLRRGEYGIDYIDTHMILLDNYLILAKITKNTTNGNNGSSSSLGSANLNGFGSSNSSGANGSFANSRNNPTAKYLVTKKPIAMELLVIEQADGEPVAKSNTKMITGVLSGNTAEAGRRLSKIYNAASSPSSESSANGGNTFRTNSNISLNGTGANGKTSPNSPVVTVLNSNNENENIIFPIKIRDLGQNKKTYVIYTQTEDERKNWVNKILAAKREYSSAVYAYNAEPFKLRVIETGFFNYESLSESPKIPLFTEANPMDRALRDYETVNSSSKNTSLMLNTKAGNSGSTLNKTGFANNNTTNNAPVDQKKCAQSRINCVVTCNHGGKLFFVVGTDNGIYACDMTIKKASKQQQERKKGRKPVNARNERNGTSNHPVEDELNQVDSAAWASSGWIKCLNIVKVTQMEVLTDYNLLIVLTDKTLVYYHLDQFLSIVMNAYHKPRDNHMAGYAISSRNRDVTYFATGYMTSGMNEKRELLFYKCKDPKDTLKKSSLIEILEPVKERGTQKKRSHFVVAGAGRANSNNSNYSATSTNTMDSVISIDRSETSHSSTEYFKSYDQVYIPQDSYGITLLSSTFFVHCAKGFQLLSLNFIKYQPKLVPEPSSIPLVMHRGFITSSNYPYHSSPSSYIHQSNSASSPIGSSLPIGKNEIKSSSTSAITSSSTADAFKRKLESSKPIASFMINDNTILLVYDQLAIFVDKYGQLSSPLHANLLCKINSAIVSYPYLITFSDELIEIRRIDFPTGTTTTPNFSSMGSSTINGKVGSGGKLANGTYQPTSPLNISPKKPIGEASPLSSAAKSRARSDSPHHTCFQLKQVITGKDIRLVDGQRDYRQIIVAMAHPKIRGQQIMVELIGNEFVVDDDNSSLLGL